MPDLFPDAVDDIGTMQDRKGDRAFVPVHPRLQLAARAKLERLRKRLRASYADAAERLEFAIAQMRAFLGERDASGAWLILGELEMALADVRTLAGSELLDASGIASLERKLILANEDLKVLRDQNATRLPGGDGEGRDRG